MKHSKWIALFLVLQTFCYAAGEIQLGSKDLDDSIVIRGDHLKVMEKSYPQIIPAMCQTQADLECKQRECGPNLKCTTAVNPKCEKIPNKTGHFRSIDGSLEDVTTDDISGHLFLVSTGCVLSNPDPVKEAVVMADQGMKVVKDNTKQSVPCKINENEQLNSLAKPTAGEEDALTDVSEISQVGFGSSLLTKLKENAVPALCVLGGAAALAGYKCGEKILAEKAQEYIKRRVGITAGAAMAIVTTCSIAFEAAGVTPIIEQKLKSYMKSQTSQMTCLPTPEDKAVRKTSEYEKKHSELQQKFEALKSKLQPQTVQMIVSKFKEYDQSIEYVRAALKKGEAPGVNLDYLERYLGVIEYALSSPAEIKKLNPAEYEPKLDAFLSTYPPEFAAQFKRAVRKMRTDSAAPDTLAPSKNIIFLLGAPGTGKTTLARAFGGLIGLDMQVLDMPNGSGEDITGAGYYGVGDPKPGNLLKTVSRQKYKNDGIVIDEIDKLFSDQNQNSGGLKREVLDLLEPNTPIYTDKGTTVPMDVSKKTFVLAGNAIPDIPGFDRRVVVIKVPPFNYEQKSLIAKKIFDDLFTKNPHLDFKRSSLTAEDHKMIEKICKEDRQDGIAIIQKVINEYFLYRDEEIENTRNHITTPPFDIVKSFEANGQKKVEPEKN